MKPSKGPKLKGVFAPSLLYLYPAVFRSHSCVGVFPCRLQEDPEAMKIDFNVYQADAVSRFKKTNPGKPHVRMCVRRYLESCAVSETLRLLLWK